MTFKTVKLDSTHITMKALRKLAPEVLVRGGGFGSSLPDPTQLTPNQRREAMTVARQIATNLCVAELLKDVGLPRDTEVESGDSGERLWPDGYLGSLTHKGTVVLGVMVAHELYRGIGVDVERLNNSNLYEIRDIIAPEGINEENGISETIVFSAKEAIYKAQYPVTGEKLSFSDVRIDWATRDGETLIGKSVCFDNVVEVRTVTHQKWVVSFAVT